MTPRHTSGICYSSAQKLPERRCSRGADFLGITSRLKASSRDRRGDRRGVFWEKMSENSKIGERDIKRVGVSMLDLRFWIIIVDISSTKLDRCG